MRADQTQLTDAEDWRDQVNASDYGAAYFPWLRMINPNPQENDLVKAKPKGACCIYTAKGKNGVQPIHKNHVSQ